MGTLSDKVDKRLEFGGADVGVSPKLIRMEREVSVGVFEVGGFLFLGAES